MDFDKIKAEKAKHSEARGSKTLPHSDYERPGPSVRSHYDDAMPLAFVFVILIPFLGGVEGCVRENNRRAEVYQRICVDEGRDNLPVCEDYAPVE